MPPAGISVCPIARVLRKPEIVSIERDVEHAHRDHDAFERMNACGESNREWESTGWDAEQDRIPRALGLFEDLVGDPIDDPRDVRGCQDDLRVTGIYTGRIGHMRI